MRKSTARCTSWKGRGSSPRKSRMRCSPGISTRRGARGLGGRSDDRRTRVALAPLEDGESARHVAAERSLLATLEGGCQAPVAAYVGTRDSGLGTRLFGRVTALDGSVQITASVEIDAGDPSAAGVAVAGLLQGQGASRLLAR